MPEPVTLTMPAACDLRAVRSLQAAMLAALDRGADVTLDCAAVERADVAFVQLVAAAGQSAARRGARLGLANRSAAVATAWARAGVACADPLTPTL